MDLNSDLRNVHWILQADIYMLYFFNFSSPPLAGNINRSCIFCDAFDTSLSILFHTVTEDYFTVLQFSCTHNLEKC
jgi:hypothetical protein